MLPGVPAAKTVNELLRRAPRCGVDLLSALKQRELGAESGVQLACCVTRDCQAAALCRPVRTEGGDDCKAIGLERLNNACNIPFALVIRGQEVKYSPVMPDIERMCRPISIENVSRSPSDATTVNANALPRNLQRRGRNIQYGEVAVAACKQVIYQCGLSAPHIDDGRTLVRCRPADILKRTGQVRRIPADRFGRLGAVDSVPICL